MERRSMERLSMGVWRLWAAWSRAAPHDLTSDVHKKLFYAAEADIGCALIGELFLVSADPDIIFFAEVATTFDVAFLQVLGHRS